MNNNISGSATAVTREYHAPDSVTSRDGTVIGYRQLGCGPGLALVQGTMGTAHHFKQLAEALADTFTVYTPDRRGRGMSPSGGDDYSVQKEIEDLDALLAKTGAHYVFGVSAGALISLQAALTLPAIHKVAIYEPPLFLNSAPTEAITRYENEMAQGRVAAALVTAMVAGQMGPPIFNIMPRWLLEALTNMGMKSEDRKGSGGYVPMRTLASTLHYDFHVVIEMSGKLERFRAINAETLLLGGSQSPAYLKTALDALEKVLPRVTRIELPGLGHAAPWNTDRGGKPAPVARELWRFFA